jgi:hypothetical protein
MVWAQESARTQSLLQRWVRSSLKHLCQDDPFLVVSMLRISRGNVAVVSDRLGMFISIVAAQMPGGAISFAAYTRQTLQHVGHTALAIVGTSKSIALILMLIEWRRYQCHSWMYAVCL